MLHTQSLADRVYETVEEGIYSGEYPADTFFTELGLSAQLGVSRTPVREALRRLEQEKLVEETGKGMRVLPITEQDVEDIYDIRLRTEGLACRWAAQRVSDAQLARMKEQLEMQQFYTGKANGSGAESCDAEFHASLYEACGSHTLEHILETLHRRTRQYRRRSLSDSGRAVLAEAEHTAIFAALSAHDPDAAEKAAMTHIQNAKAFLMQA